MPSARGPTGIEDPQQLALVSLLQMGLARRLPEPSVRVFGLPVKTKKVNFSDAAFGYGTINLVAHSINTALAAAGGALQAGIAAKYQFHQMPKIDRARCPYGRLGAATDRATFALATPEALTALRRP